MGSFVHHGVSLPFDVTNLALVSRETDARARLDSALACVEKTEGDCAMMLERVIDALRTYFRTLFPKKYRALVSDEDSLREWRGAFEAFAQFLCDEWSALSGGEGV